MPKCPGQDQRFWKAGDIFEVKCPGCGAGTEFFKDEPSIKCRKCGRLVANPKIDLGCAEWCQYADQCLGIQAGARRENLMAEMKQVFGTDEKRVRHALAVLKYAEQIQAEEGGDPLVVKAAAILHDIGIIEAERRYGSSAPRYHESEGPPIAEAILGRYDVEHKTAEHIRRIVGSHHTADDIDTIEFRIVSDADLLVNLREQTSHITAEALREIIDKKFKTDKGRRIAIESFVKNQS